MKVGDPALDDRPDPLTELAHTSAVEGGGECTEQDALGHILDGLGRHFHRHSVLDVAHEAEHEHGDSEPGRVTVAGGASLQEVDDEVVLAQSRQVLLALSSKSPQDSIQSWPSIAS